MNDETTIYTPDVAGDKQLVFDLISSMYAGIALMMQAQQRKLDKNVIDLADDLESDHTKMLEELKMYASEKGWLIPAGELDKDVATRQEMATLDNTTYEQRWLAALQERHQASIAELENALPSDSKLQSMGGKSLSKLKKHLGDIMDLEAKVN